jgi:hypothetical protein
LRFTNTAILALLIFLTLTGLYGLVFSLQGWAFELHRWAGWALVVLVPWKAMISARSLRRGPGATFDRSAGIAASLTLTLLIVIVGGFGLLWMWSAGPKMLTLFGFSDTLISWHWMLGLILLPLFVLHSARNWPRPKKRDFISRRGFIWTAGITGLAVVGWRGAEVLAQAREFSPRRWTGSREEGSFSGNDFPVTAMARDGRERVDLGAWRLEVSGGSTEFASYGYDSLLSMNRTTVEATLDCTVGWYSTQEWTGIPLIDLLKLADYRGLPTLVRLQAAEGYFHVYGPGKLDEIILATHVGGQQLEHRHGFPLRAVVPSRRGWAWVKWLARVQVLA